MGGYGYTEAWVGFLARELKNPEKYREMTDQKPKRRAWFVRLWACIRERHPPLSEIPFSESFTPF